MGSATEGPSLQSKKLGTSDPSNRTCLSMSCLQSRPQLRRGICPVIVLAEVASTIKRPVASCGRNGSVASGNSIQPEIVLVEKDSWISGEEHDLNAQKLDWKQNGHAFKLPKFIFLATKKLSQAESDNVRAAGFADTVIMKPLRASMLAAYLQEVGDKQSCLEEILMLCRWPWL